MKTISDGWRPQNVIRGISQQPLIVSSSNFKLKLRGTNQIKVVVEFEMKTNSDRPPMDYDLKILKVEYLSNQWSDPPRFSNLSLGDQTKMIFG